MLTVFALAVYSVFLLVVLDWLLPRRALVIWKALTPGGELLGWSAGFIIVAGLFLLTISPFIIALRGAF